MKMLGIGGALLLLAFLFLPWYAETVEINTCDSTGGHTTEDVTGNGWGGQGPLGTLANLVILAAGLGAVAVAVMVWRGSLVDPRIVLVVGICLIVAMPMIVGRMVFNPGGDALDSTGGTKILDHDASTDEAIEHLDDEFCEVTQREHVGLSWGIFVALIAAGIGAFGAVASQRPGALPGPGRDRPPTAPG